MVESVITGRKEKLRASIQERVDKEEHAYRLVEKMVLIESVEKAFLVNAAKYITTSHYKDITKERAIAKYCGYPLCNERVKQVLKQKYRISLRERKVFDITERKDFCSNFCYKASKYFESQLSAEPVWMREITKFPPLKLLEDGAASEETFSGLGNEVAIVNRKREDIRRNLNDNIEQENIYRKHSAEDINVEENAVYEEENDSEHGNIYYDEENDSEHGNIYYDEENAEKDFDDIHNNIYLEDKELECIVDRRNDVKIDVDINSLDSDDDDNTADEENIIHNIDVITENKNVIETVDCIDDKSSVHTDYHYSRNSNFGAARQFLNHDKPQMERTENKLHNVLCEWCTVETKDCLATWFVGKQNVTDQTVNGDQRRMNNGKFSSFPPKSQTAIRGEIVSEKLNKAISPMLGELNLNAADISCQLTSLLKTFRFSNKNIVLNSLEWTITGLVLLLVLIKTNSSLKEIVSQQQSNLHPLIARTVDDESILDRLMEIFNIERYVNLTEGFNMEEMD